MSSLFPLAKGPSRIPCYHNNISSKDRTQLGIYYLTEPFNILDLASFDKMTDNVIKIMVIGDIGVGKTSIIRRYVDSDYSPEYRISVQLDFRQKQVAVGERRVNIQLWDVPGQERFGGMTSVYYKYSHGALVTFDLARYNHSKQDRPI